MKKREEEPMPYKILTVDDKHVIRMIVKRAFKPFDCEIFEAENGMQGVKMAKKHLPDLIFLDVIMPIMGGIAALKKMREEPELKETPIIMLTAEADKSTVLDIVKTGVQSYIVKPMKIEQLIERASQFLDLELKSENVGKALMEKYITIDGDFSLLKLPKKLSRSHVVEMENLFKQLLKDRDASGFKKLILNMEKLETVTISAVRIIDSIMEKCIGAGVMVGAIGKDVIAKEMEGISELQGIKLYKTLEEAKVAFQLLKEAED